MGSNGIKDRVAIVGMGCTRFGEHWDKGADDLLLWSTSDALDSRRAHQARHRRVLARYRHVGHAADWRCPARSSCRTSRSPGSRTSARPARRRCATRRTRSRPAPTTSRWPSASRRSRTAATRGWAAARRKTPTDGTEPHPRPRRRCSRCARPPTARSTASATSRCARCSPASRGRTTTTAPATSVRSSARKSRWRPSAVRRSWRATLRRVRLLRRRRRQRRGDPVRAEDAHRYTDKPLYVKALSFVAGNASGNADPDYDYTWFPEIHAAGQDAYAAGRRHRPARTDRDGGGARLLHARRAAHLRGPRVRRAGHGLEGGARRHLRPRRRPAGQPRRRA